MPNRNYLNGKAKEHRVKKKLVDEGYIVVRSAGSKSPFDLVAINKETKTIKIIQCKPKSFSDNKKKELMEEYAWLNTMFKCAFEVR